MNIQQFVNRYRVSASAKWADKNPNMADMPSGSSHYKVTLRHDGRQLTVHFSQGPAICQEPTAKDVLNCLVSDACGFDNAQSFEDWASEYGYDADSRKAERTYKVVERQTTALKRVFGDLFDTLVYHTEGL